MAYVLTKTISLRKNGVYSRVRAHTGDDAYRVFCVHTLHGCLDADFSAVQMPQIEGSWYLTADYTVKCQEGSGTVHDVAGLGIVVYVLGLPAFQLYILLTNRANLHRTDCEDPQAQRVVEKQYGSIYVHYTPESFYLTWSTFFAGWC